MTYIYLQRSLKLHIYRVLRTVSIFLIPNIFNSIQLITQPLLVGFFNRQLETWMPSALPQFLQLWAITYTPIAVAWGWKTFCDWSKKRTELYELKFINGRIYMLTHDDNDPAAEIV